MSESMTCCPLGEADETYEHFSESIVKAAKGYACEECGTGAIAKGDKHEVACGYFDGAWHTHRTCLSCREIRNHFACGSWIFGQLWEDIENNFFPAMKAGGPCMDGLSPAAKARLFELRDVWLMDNADSVDHPVYQDPR